MYLVWTLCITVELYVMKAIFVRNPELSVFQITLLKAIIANTILGLSLNKRLKSIMWDTVHVDTIPSLCFKTFQGSIGVLLAYYAIRAFQISTVGIVSSISPLLVCLMAYLVLGEKVKATEIVGLVIVIIGIILVVIGVQGTDRQ